jgi:CubicO group peptidase (beta-lactamase class C family)
MGLLRTAALVAFTAVFVGIAPYYMKKSPPLIFGGQVKPGFENVQKAFEENFKNNLEPEGAAFAAYYKGELVVDIWGGYADVYLRKSWTNDTLGVVFSTTKVIKISAVFSTTKVIKVWFFRPLR